MKRKWETTVFDKYGCKNPQQNTRKLNLTPYEMQCAILLVASLSQNGSSNSTHHIYAQGRKKRGVVQAFHFLVWVLLLVSFVKTNRFQKFLSRLSHLFILLEKTGSFGHPQIQVKMGKRLSSKSERMSRLAYNNHDSSFEAGKSPPLNKIRILLAGRKLGRLLTAFATTTMPYFFPKPLCPQILTCVILTACMVAM